MYTICKLVSTSSGLQFHFPSNVFELSCVLRENSIVLIHVKFCLGRSHDAPHRQIQQNWQGLTTSPTEIPDHPLCICHLFKAFKNNNN